MRPVQVTNLAKMTSHLIIDKSQSLAVLKVIQFSDMNKRNVAFLRQVLLGVLLDKNTDEVMAIFEAIAEPPKLNLFRESLRLFMHHFLIKQSSKLSQDVDHDLMKERIKRAENVIMSGSSKLKL